MKNKKLDKKDFIKWASKTNIDRLSHPSNDKLFIKEFCKEIEFDDLSQDEKNSLSEWRKEFISAPKK